MNIRQHRNGMYLGLYESTVMGWQGLTVFENHTNKVIFWITQRFKIVQNLQLWQEFTSTYLKFCSVSNMFVILLTFLGKFNTPRDFFIRLCVWQTAQHLLLVLLVFGGLPWFRNYDII